MPTKDTLKESWFKKLELERQLDSMIDQLRELLKLQQRNYEPYNEKQTKIAIRALLNIRGFKNLKSFHYGDNEQ